MQYSHDIPVRTAGQRRKIQTRDSPDINHISTTVWKWSYEVVHDGLEFIQFVPDQRIWSQGFSEHGKEPSSAMTAGVLVINWISATCTSQPFCYGCSKYFCTVICRLAHENDLFPFLLPFFPSCVGTTFSEPLFCSTLNLSDSCRPLVWFNQGWSLMAPWITAGITV